MLFYKITEQYCSIQMFFISLRKITKYAILFYSVCRNAALRQRNVCPTKAGYRSAYRSAKLLVSQFLFIALGNKCKKTKHYVFSARRSVQAGVGGENLITPECSGIVKFSNSPTRRSVQAVLVEKI